MAALLTFYVQTWDEYHTHTLTLGIISGPVEGILTLCFVYAFTAYIGGGSFWQQSLLRTIGIPKYAFIPNLMYELAWNEWYMVYGGVILVFNTIQRYSSAYPRYVQQPSDSRTPALLTSSMLAVPGAYAHESHS